jgi:ABC-type sugar transport system ATPase subunit
MIGQNLDNYFIKEKETEHSEEVILSVEELTVPGRLDAISFKLHKGETLGITGLLGSGHDLIPRCIFGIEKTGVVLRKKEQVLRPKSSRDALKAGLGLVTENRQAEGLFLKMSVLKNATVLVLEKISTRFLGWIRRTRENQLGNRYIELMNVMTPSLNQIIRNLSGGNQQKVIMARWLMRDSDILMFIEPTRGIDVGARSEIYQYLHRIAREEGKGIIVVSTELAEVIGVSDRILAMYNGRIVEEIPKQMATEEYLMKRITGG